jgi:DNA-binding NarL/FixJ family response regulator
VTAAVLARPRQTELSVVLVDDQPVVRSGLRALLAGAAGITVVGEASTAQDSVREALRHEPDVLVVDLPMRGPAGIGAVTQLLAAAPGVAVLMFTACDDDESVFNAMRAGARGYLLKGAEQDDIVRAIRGVAAGEAIFGASIARRLTELMTRQIRPDRHPFPELTARERGVLELIAAGRSNTAIAQELYLAPKTVRNNISVIFAKLGVADRSQAIVRARQAGLGA